MANNVTFFSSNDGPAHQVRIFDDAGSLVAGPIAATHVAANTYAYNVTVPGSLAFGHYTFAAYRTSNNRLRSSGEFYWDGSDRITESEYNAIINTQGAIDQAVVDINAHTTSEVDTAVIGIRDRVDNRASWVYTQIAALLAAGVPLDTETIGTIAQGVEQALLDEADGNPVLAAIAASVEAAIANEGDANATLAAFQGAVAAALSDYNTATSTNVSDAQTAIIGAMPTPSDATLSKQDAILAAIAALPAPGDATLAQQSEILSAVATNLNLLEADEDFQQGKVIKYLKGTQTKLLEKNVTGGAQVVPVTFTDEPV